MPLQRSESASKDAQTREETEADTSETFGVLNQHPNATTSFKVGVASDQNRKSRRSMEEYVIPHGRSWAHRNPECSPRPLSSAHSFIYDFGGIRGQGYFAVFDGHAGKACAEWCGEHFHEVRPAPATLGLADPPRQHLLEALLKSPTTPIPDVLNATFHSVDKKLSELAVTGGTHSGCTAVTAFLRLEDEDGSPVGNGGGVGSGVAVSSAPLAQEVTASDEGTPAEGEGKAGGIGNKLKGLLSGRSIGTPDKAEPPSDPVVHVSGPADVKKAARRTLYTANAGDARAVLS